MQRLHDRAQSARGKALAAIIVGSALATTAHAQTSDFTTSSKLLLTGRRHERRGIS